MEKGTENTRVTLIGIIVEDPEAAIRINGLLHEYGEYIIGRMGIPYHESQCPVGEAGNDPRSQHEVPVCPGRAKSPKIKRLSIPPTYAIIAK